MKKLLLIIVFTIVCVGAFAQQEVMAIGAMKNTMRNGAMHGQVSLDSLCQEGYYGVGPLAFLRGEILLWNGIPYVSTTQNGELILTQDAQAQAPFFVYAKVDEWLAHPLPSTVITIQDLEQFLEQHVESDSRPFAFRLAIKVDTANYHVVDVPKGKIVKSPQDAHMHNVQFGVTNLTCDILGFFSKSHQGIYTHHDSYVHLHLIDKHKSHMGHVDYLSISPSESFLFLPNNVNLK
jgi:acetolactate decarboxylase